MPQTRIPIFLVTGTEFHNHMPLAVGMLQAYAQHVEAGGVGNTYQFLPILNMQPAEVIRIGQAFGPGVWLFSNYVWSLNQTLAISCAIKAINPRNITVHGGPSTPKYPDACQQFLTEQPHVDIAVRGEGEITAAELLTQLQSYWQGDAAWYAGLEHIAGISFVREPDTTGPFVRTPDRPRIVDLNRLPSPYLSGLFDTLGPEVNVAVLETNRGCPYGCTFCDWGSLTQQKIKQFDLDRVHAEIEWVAQRRLPVLWLADANFGIFERDVAIAAMIVAAKERTGYPRELYINYAKNVTTHVADIVKMLCQAGLTTQGLVALQTTDADTLQAVQRTNIKTDQYDALVSLFRAEGLPLATDLMLGLPGATVTSFKRDLQRCFDADIGVKVYPTQLLPNSPMADPAYRARYQIEVDATQTVIGTASYRPADLQVMKHIWRLYTVCESYGMLRYVLRYLQWDHGIPALDYLHTLATHLAERPSAMTTLTLEQRQPYAHPADLIQQSGGTWAGFYAEMAAWTTRVFPVLRDSAFETVFLVNEAVMPVSGRRLPATLRLAYDVVAYYGQHQADTKIQKPLDTYPPGQLIGYLPG